MLRHRFEHWAKRRAVTLQSEQIRTEQVQKDDVDERLILDPSTGFRHESRLAMGQVTVWESRQMEYEVLNIETEELILWKYVEKSDRNEVDFDELLQEYFQALKSGGKP
ncbi:hypothetical protein [Paenibacillus xylanexedens]|uniref:immunity protein TriTu family protein n=1 Tax=Paenibacillus xylanexedens TaxID=528191 RepID=UPI0011A7BDA5|nr:hypothetical protein [Paenibacillus xylanexedens]